MYYKYYISIAAGRFVSCSSVWLTLWFVPVSYPLPRVVVWLSRLVESVYLCLLSQL